MNYSQLQINQTRLNRVVEVSIMNSYIEISWYNVSRGRKVEMGKPINWTALSRAAAHLTSLLAWSGPSMRAVRVLSAQLDREWCGETDVLWSAEGQASLCDCSSCLFNIYSSTATIQSTPTTHGPHSSRQTTLILPFGGDTEEKLWILLITSFTYFLIDIYVLTQF